MNDDDDEAMPPPKPKVTIGSPTPSEKEASNPPVFARIITTASELPSPAKNFKKQKVEETKIPADTDFLMDEEVEYIPDEYAITLTNFAYPELNSQRDFEELLVSGISNDSDLMAKIGKNMKKEQEYYDDYHRNKEIGIL